MGHHRSSITSTDVPPPNVGTHGQLAPKLRCQHRERFIARAEQTQTGTKGVPSRGRAERDRGSGKGERAGGGTSGGAGGRQKHKGTKGGKAGERKGKRKTPLELSYSPWRLGGVTPLELSFRRYGFRGVEPARVRAGRINGLFRWESNPGSKGYWTTLQPTELVGERGKRHAQVAILRQILA